MSRIFSYKHFFYNYHLFTAFNLALSAVISTTSFAAAQTPEKFLVVIEPCAAANLRKEPIDASREYINDDLQETQVLYNEILRYKGENADWYLIEAIEQQEFTHNNLWQGYPGWVRKNSVKFINDVSQYNSVVKSKTAKILSSAGKKAKVLSIISLGTRFWVIGEAGGYYQVGLRDNQAGWVKKNDCLRSDKNLNERRLRRNIVRTAKLFLKVPYLWGGRTMFIPRLKEIATGVDCSGLTNLVYRANNIDIPRDAHEQWMKSEKISPADLKTGDLIFISAKNNFQKITHVMLYIKGEYFIEASGTGNVVKIKTFKEKFGVSLSILAKQDFITDNKKIYFGNLLKAQISH